MNGKDPREYMIDPEPYEADLSEPIGLHVRQGIFFVVLLVIMTAISHYAKPTVKVPEAEKPIVAASTREIVRGDTAKKNIIFTFDGGSTAQSADAILRTLAKHKVRGTFFLTGKFVESNPDLVKRMHAEGHEIFSHTYDHPNLTEKSDAEIVAELAGMEKVLQQTVGITSRPYFRPPYGDRDARVIKVAAAEGYQSVYWTIDASDWQESEGMTADQVKQKILSTAAPGNIYLMHLGDTITGAILDGVFTELESRGYSMVSLTQGL